MYTTTSHSFHVLLKDLIPHPRQDNLYLFKHIKGARTDHIIALRAHHSKKRDEGLPPLNPDELKPHSAQHTLQFIEDEYVEKAFTVQKEPLADRGHLAGDMALREVAQRVDAQVRSSDAAARYGGDEFVVLLPDATIDQARGLAERIRATVVATPLEVSAGVERMLSVSIGMAAVAPARDKADLKGVAERLFSAADAALYRAKQAGRNRVEAESP